MFVSFEVIYTKSKHFGIITNVMFFKEVSYAHQSKIYLMKKLSKTVKLYNKYI